MTLENNLLQELSKNQTRLVQNKKKLEELIKVKKEIQIKIKEVEQTDQRFQNPEKSQLLEFKKIIQQQTKDLKMNILNDKTEIRICQSRLYAIKKY